MCVERSCCFYPILWRSHIFFRANCCGQQSIKGEEWKFTTNEGDCTNVTEPYLGRGGGGSCKVYLDTAKICVIRSEFSPMPLETFTSHRKKNITVLGGITHSRINFNSLENLIPAQVSVQSRTESHKKQSNTTQQNGTELETN